MHYRKNISRGIIVDPEDEYLLHKYLWNTSIAGYATTNIDRKTVRLHRMIMPDVRLIDHKNLNRLDNRKDNLRDADKSTNGHNRGNQINNTSGAKGIHLVGSMWRARIKLGGKYIQVGMFTTFEQAVEARDALANKLIKEFYKPIKE